MVRRTRQDDGRLVAEMWGVAQPLDQDLGTAAGADQDDGLTPPGPSACHVEDGQATDGNQNQAESEGDRETESRVEVREFEGEGNRREDEKAERRDERQPSQHLDRSEAEPGIEPGLGVADEEEREQGNQLDVDGGRLMPHRQRPQEVGELARGEQRDGVGGGERSEAGDALKPLVFCP